MAIQSMTGFGRGELVNSGLIAIVEIKSVNHRYKEVRFRMPAQHNALEMELREILFEKYKRGSFDVWAAIKAAPSSKESNQSIPIDSGKVEKYLELFKAIALKENLEISLRPGDFLRQEFYKEVTDDASTLESGMLKEAFQRACENLQKSRLGEGHKLNEVLQAHLKEYTGHFGKIEGQANTLRPKIEERLRLKFKEFSKDLPTIDEPRFLQEIVYYLEKLDISEEINRIHSHLKKMNSLLGKGDEAGRQIDFLVQELNRETNTIGSKSGEIEISDMVVGMKNQLEKIREQGLNIE